MVHITDIMSMISLAILQALEALFADSDAGTDHGYAHAIAVMNHAICAADELKLKPKRKYAVMLAALLHDADDRKFFKTANYANARRIMVEDGVDNAIIDLVIEMIDLVSMSKHGNNIYNVESWKLIPRYADRIEAIGREGLRRCLIFNLRRGQPLYLPDTPRVTTLDALSVVAAPRFADYVSGRNPRISLIDHCIDSLVHRHVHTGIAYFDQIIEERIGAIHEVIFQFGRNGTITEAEIRNICGNEDQN